MRGLLIKSSYDWQCLYSYLIPMPLTVHGFPLSAGNHALVSIDPCPSNTVQKFHNLARAKPLIPDELYLQPRLIKLFITSHVLA